MKKINNQGFVLLETVVVSVFIISIFTFIYVSVVPLLGKYEDLTHDYDIDTAYKLYHVRDAMYKDSDFYDIVSSGYKRVESSDFSDIDYYNSLESSLFGDTDYQIVYIRKIVDRVDAAISDLSIESGFKKYIKKIASTKAEKSLQNVIFLENNGNYAYLGLAVDLNDTTSYEEPEEYEEPDSFSHYDPSNPNPPLLMDGMIPIYYDSEEGTWNKADKNNKSDKYPWYNYPEFKWANIALVKESKRTGYLEAQMGTVVNTNDIIAFYVWIPRYEYYIDGTYGLGGTSALLPGEINVEFIDTSIAKVRAKDSKTWRTPSAFTFGSDELTGIWFAKFEMSNSESKGYSYNGNAIPYVLPDVYAWTGRKVASIYQNITTYMNSSNGEKIYGLGSSTYTSDAHVMKNDEWGAVAYLSQSKYGKYANDAFTGANKEVYANNRQASNNDLSAITGSSAGTPATGDFVTKECSSRANNTAAGCYKYFVEGVGTGASTTGTIYGVYDMSGGTNENVMGARGLKSTESPQCGSRIYSGNYTEFTGFRGPLSKDSVCNNDSSDLAFPTNEKYYNSYCGAKLNGCYDGVMFCTAVCYSHAMGETNNWYGNSNEAPQMEAIWVQRGGHTQAFSSGVFSINAFNGSTSDPNVTNTAFTSRPIIAVY